ncbi:MAG: twitching motility protein PilT [Chloroflexi bacterium]|nr:MAG: twitching motility protein PilT [Chloroflexota bacterium]
MAQITLKFYGEINFFLPQSHRGHTYQPLLNYKTSIKDFIEALGIPHPEIGELLVNNQAVGFDYQLLEDQAYSIAVYARTLKDSTQLRPPLIDKPRFILDTHLGRLANLLRMMGFDTLYRNDYPDDELAYVSHHEQRVLLTRDIGVLKRSLVIYGRFIRETNPHKQIVEVLHAFNLLPHISPFKRCIKCNGMLNPVKKDEIINLIPENSARHFEIFHQCTTCNQVYWKGSHYDKMQSYIEAVINLT